MKKTNAIVLALTMVVLGFSNKTMARTLPINYVIDLNSNIAIKQLDNLKFKVSFLKPITEKATLKILDENGNELVSEVFYPTNAMQKLYNFSALADGRYTIKVAYGELSEQKEVVIETKINRIAQIASN